MCVMENIGKKQRIINDGIELISARSEDYCESPVDMATWPADH